MNSYLPRPSLIDVDEAAALLSVSPRTVLGWIAEDALPYVESPEPPHYRLPLHGLVRSLPELYDLPTEFREADDVVTYAAASAQPRVTRALTTVAASTLHVAERAPGASVVRRRARALQHYSNY